MSEEIYDKELDEVLKTAKKILDEMPEWKKRYAQEIIDRALKGEEVLPNLF